MLYQVVHSQPYDRLEDNNLKYVVSFVVQRGAVISSQPGLQRTVNAAPEVVRKQIYDLTAGLRTAACGAPLLDCYSSDTYISDQSALNCSDWQNHNTSAPTNSLVIKTILCCFVCVGKSWAARRMPSSPALLALNPMCSASSPRSAPAELKLWILSAFQIVPLSAHSALSPWQ